MPGLFIGLMSGTSLDGIYAARAELPASRWCTISAAEVHVCGGGARILGAIYRV